MNAIEKFKREMIADVYARKREAVWRYVTVALQDSDAAEDLVQDTFEKLLCYESIILPETVENLVMTIARNLVTDYMRHKTIKNNAHASIYDYTPAGSNDCESAIIARDIERLERKRLAMLPPQRMRIYRMVRYEGMNNEEVADALHLSKRTVENHLLIVRKEIREYIKNAI